MNKIYIPVKLKFILSLIIILLWQIFSCYICYLWMINMALVLPIWLSFIIALTVAFLPGIMIVLTWCGVMFDKPRDYPQLKRLPDITILVPVHNGQDIIYETAQYIAKQYYRGRIFCRIIDNKSTDNTAAVIHKIVDELTTDNIKFEYCYEGRPGKFYALNGQLPTVKTKYVITIDDDTLLWRNALTQLTTHMVVESENKKIGAVAGAVMVRNSRTNLLTRMQEWDYFMSMAGLKRSQSLFSATLVAQGAFSIYDTELVKRLGGWPDAIVEDMVLSWDIIAEGYQIQYEPQALSFTTVPTKLCQFIKQRIRWSRGPIECSRRHLLTEYTGYSKWFIALDYLMTLVDFGLIVFWLPGLFLALFTGNFLIVGPFTCLMLPITVFLYWCHYRKQKECVFDLNGLTIRKNKLGLVCFTLFYHLITAFCGIYGYISELFNLKRVWK